MPTDPDALAAALEAAGLYDAFYEATELELSSDDANADPGTVITGADDRRFIGHEAAGGAFYELGDGTILFVGSEGEMGVVGASLNAFVATALGLPGWHDAAHHAGGPDLAAARASYEAWLVEWGVFAARADPEIAAAILDAMDAEPSADPFADLHRALVSTPPRLRVTYEGNDFMRLGAGGN